METQTLLCGVLLFLIGTMIVLMIQHDDNSLHFENIARDVLRQDKTLSQDEKRILSDTAGWKTMESGNGGIYFQYIDPRPNGYHRWILSYDDKLQRWTLRDPVIPYTLPTSSRPVVTTTAAVPGVVPTYAAPSTYYQPSLLTTRDIMPDRFGLRGIRTVATSVTSTPASAVVAPQSVVTPQVIV